MDRTFAVTLLLWKHVSPSFPHRTSPPIRDGKKKPDFRESGFKIKKSGIELLSHTLLCSIIVARPLNDRVRDGNVCCKPAIDTGKNMYKEEDDKGSKRL